MLGKILCAHEEHYLFDKKYGYSACNQYIYHSLQGSGLFEQVIFFSYDQLTQLGIDGMCNALYEKCINERPQAIIFYVPWQGLWEPLTTVLDSLRYEGIKVIAFYSDLATALATDARYNLFREYSKNADCLLNIDSICLPNFFNHPLHVRGYTGVDPGIFFWKPVKKDIDVCFLGSRAQSYNSRREYITFLKENLDKRGIGFLVDGGQLPEEKSLPLKDYVDRLRRSKISLNFSRTLGDLPQIKGRVFETMACRTFLLEEENSITRTMFEEGTDYRSFSSKEDLLEKILFYLEKEEEREAVANAGWQKVKELWSARNLWGYVFEKMGFDLSQRMDDHFFRFRRLMDELQNRAH